MPINPNNVGDVLAGSAENVWQSGVDPLISQQGRSMFAESLGQSVLDGWSAGAVDPGASFLNGEVTTAFAISNRAADVSNAAANLMGDMGNAWNSGGQLYDQISNGETWANLEKSIKKGVSDAATKAFNDDIVPYSEALAKQIALDSQTCWTTYLAQRTAYWTKVYTQDSITYYLSVLSETIDGKMDKMKENEWKILKEDNLKKAAKTVSYIYNAVNTATAYIQNGINVALELINAGPEYVESAVTKTINSVLVPAKKELNAIVKDATAEMYKQADKVAKQAGAAAGEKISKGVYNQAKNLKAKTEAGKVTVLATSIAAVKVAEQKAMALLGM